MAFRDEVEAVDRRYLEACKRRDAAGAAAGYTEDGVYVAAGGAPQRGRAAIAAGLAAVWNAGMVDTGLTVLNAEADGNIGYAIERVESTAGNGVALLVFRRDAQGTWKICAEAFVLT